MAKDKQYTSADIQSLTDREHVRLRTQIYLGNMHPAEYTIPSLTSPELEPVTVEFIPAVFKAVGEVIDNSIDEFSQTTSKNKVLTINAKPEEGWYEISDTGRGIPIGIHPVNKLPTPQVALGSLRAGRNFSSDKEVGVIGQNGVGAACTNYCSKRFEVTILRDGQKYEQVFTDGANTVSKPKITKTATTKTGTTISFQLDPTVFQNVALPDELLRNRAIEIAAMNPDITVVYNGTKYQYKKGLSALLEPLSSKKTVLQFTVEDDTVVGNFNVVLNGHDGVDEQMYTWVNSSLLFDGGKCNTQFFNVVFDKVFDHLARAAKAAKTTVTRNDVRAGLLVFADLKVKNPEYDSQSKTRLTGPDLRKEFVAMVDSQWKNAAKKGADWLKEVLERATQRHHRSADREAQEEHKKKKRQAIVGLLDASSKSRSSCRILITEGESAQSQICEVRDPETTAAYALTGKINNVYGATPAQALKMGKITELLVAIGLTPGKRAVRSELNYGEIVIATDADHDGDDIFTLLVNLFHHFWPELFDPKYEPIIKRLVAPNVCLVKGAKRIHFSNRAEYDRHKDKYKGYEVRYYKGLGSMAPEDWKMILSGETDTLIPIVDDGNIGSVLQLLFGPDTDARKDWLQAKE